MQEPDQVLDAIAHSVIGAAIEVHRELGPGFLESTYAKALAIELSHRDIKFVQEAAIQLAYKGKLIGEGRLDLLVEDRLIVELKAAERIAPIHHAQVVSYLKATGKTIGLLINFNVEVLRDGIKRIILS
ncbi:MAG: GxxExxY protein [Phycisphaeraceae bacterium]